MKEVGPVTYVLYRDERAYVATQDEWERSWLNWWKSIQSQPEDLPTL